MAHHEGRLLECNRRTGRRKNRQEKAEWIKILTAFKAEDKKSNDVVAHLQSEYNVPRYWARTLTTMYLKGKE
ncbi:MAG: hypothetical protein JWO03_2178 [Bacteroidetes bacterium]|nr:hypothetical protein [Bacteroidota bacterium]